MAFMIYRRICVWVNNNRVCIQSALPKGLSILGVLDIFDIQLKRVERLLATRFLEIDVTAGAKQALCDAGFDPAFGARPLKRAIQQYLLNPMSKAIVAGGYGPGDTVKVDVEGSGEDASITFECIPAPPESEGTEDEATATDQKALPPPPA